MPVNRGRELANPTDPSGDDSESSGAWADGDLGNPPETPARARALGLASTAFGIAAPPAPAPASVNGDEADDDPIESLFRADQTLRAPSIPAAPSEAEVTRWRATVRSSSMFDEQVSDPIPGQDEPLRAAPEPMGNNLELSIDPRIAARARARAQALAAAVAPVQVPPAAGAAIERGAATRRRPAAPGTAAPPPPAAARRGGKEATDRSGVRSKGEPVADFALEMPAAGYGEMQASADDALEPTSARRRGLRRGPGPALLAVLGVAALLAFGTAAVLIGLVANPFADTPPATAPAARPTAPVVAQPRAVKPSAVPKAQAAAVPLAPPTAGAPVEAQPPTAAAPDTEAAAKQGSAVPAVAAPAPATSAAAVAKSGEEPVPVVAPEQVARPAAKPRAAAPAASDEAASSSSLLTAARKFLADDEPGRAEEAMRELLARDPSDHHAMELLVRALMDQDRGQDAVPFARKMVQRRTKRVPYRLLLGDVLLMVGDEAGARAEWQAALALAPEDREIRRRLGL